MQVSANAASNNIMLAGVGVTYPGPDPWTVRVPSGVVSFFSLSFSFLFFSLLL